MNLFAVNLVLAFIWAALFGSFTLAALCIGFVVGAIVLWALGPSFQDQSYVARLKGIVMLSVSFVYELLVSSLQVAVVVLSPKPNPKAAVLALRVDARSDLEQTLLANLISLTPGSLTFDVSDNRDEFAVHAMFVDDPDAARSDLKRGLEQRLLDALR